MSREVRVNVKTLVDSKASDELISDLKALESNKIDVPIGTSGIRNAVGELGAVQGALRSTGAGVDDLSGQINASGGSWKTFSSAAESALSSVKSGLKSAGQGVMDFSNSLSGLERLATTGLGALGLGGVFDLTIGAATDSEVNKVLMKGMVRGDQKAADQLYKTVQDATDKSLMGMRELIPAMTAFSSATGASAKEMEHMGKVGAQLGSVVKGRGAGARYSEEITVSALEGGLKGNFGILRDYGITEESLKATGSWKGAEKDVEGYLNAVEKVLEGSDELMKTTAGRTALIGKNFKTAGREMGESNMLPYIEKLQRFMLKLSDQSYTNIIRLILGLSSLAFIIGPLALIIKMVGTVWGTMKKIKRLIWDIGGGIKRVGKTVWGGLRGQGWRDSWRRAGNKGHMGTVRVTPKCVPLCNRTVKAVGGGAGKGRGAGAGAAAGAGLGRKGKGKGKGAARGLGKIAASLAFIPVPGARVIAIMVAIGAAIAVLATHWDEAKAAFQGFIDWVSEGLAPIKEAWDSFTQSLSDAWDNYISIIKENWEGFLEWFHSWYDPIKEAWDSFTQSLSDAWSGFTGWLNEKWAEAWAILKPAWDKLQATWNSIMSGLKGAWNDFVSHVRNNPPPDYIQQKYRSHPDISFSSAAPFNTVPAGGFVGDNMPVVGDDAGGVGDHSTGSYKRAVTHPSHIGKTSKSKSSNGSEPRTVININSFITDRDVVKTIEQFANTSARRRKARTRRLPWE